MADMAGARHMSTKLLLIEDSLTTQRVVQTAFTPEAMEIVTANTAAEALHILHTFVPDVVVVDAFLPGIDGFHLCQIIRETMGFHDIPIILLTSNFSPYDETRGAQVGVTDHLPKPFEPQALRLLIQQHMTPPQALPQPPSPAPATSGVTLPGKPARSVTDNVTPLMSVVPPAPREPVDELAAIMAQWTPGAVASAVPSECEALHPLGQAVLTMLRETLQQQLAALVTQLTPQILAAVQEMVTTKIADLLEVLLQREIERLKQEIAAHEHEGA